MLRGELGVRNDFIGDSCCGELGDVVRGNGHDFDNIGADDLLMATDSFEDGQALPIGQAAGIGCARAGRHGKIQSVDIKSDIYLRCQGLEDVPGYVGKRIRDDVRRKIRNVMCLQELKFFPAVDANTDRDERNVHIENTMHDTGVVVF